MNTNARIKNDESHVVGTYYCQICSAKFQYTTGKLQCPNCKCHQAPSLVAIYVEDDAKLDELRGLNSWTAGD